MAWRVKPVIVILVSVVVIVDLNVFFSGGGCSRKSGVAKSEEFRRSATDPPLLTFLVVGLGVVLCHPPRRIHSARLSDSNRIQNAFVHST